MNFDPAVVRDAFAVEGAGDNRHAMPRARQGMRHLVRIRTDPSPARFRRILLRDVADVQRCQMVCGKLLMT